MRKFILYMCCFIALIGTASAFGPHSHIAVSPDGKTEYVPGGGGNISTSGNVSVIDTATNEVLSTITLPPNPTTRRGENPGDVAISLDGSKLYVVCASDFTDLFVIDPKTNGILTYIRTVTIGYPLDVMMSPDGTRFYLSDFDHFQVAVIDTTTDTKTGSLSKGLNMNAYPQGLAETSDSSKVYVMCPMYKLEVFDTKTNTLLKMISTGFSQYLEMRGNLLYLDNGIVIDTTTDTIVANLNSMTPQIIWDNPGDIIFGTALNSTQLNAVASYRWNEVPGTFAYTPSSGTILSAGIHTLQAVFTPTDNINYKTATANVTINVLENPVPPVANFSSNVTSGTMPLTISFTDTSTGSPTSWKWTFGDGNTSTEQNPANTYSTVGKYTVKLTVKNSAGSGIVTKSKYITVTDGVVTPNADFTVSSTSGNVPLTISFTDTSTGSPTSWKWIFGDGNTSTEQNPANTYSKVGNYTVKLTAKNSAGSGLVTKSNYITVLAPPIAAFSASPIKGKAPLTVTFTDKSKGSPNSWAWNFGDGNTSAGQNPLNIYSKAGTYTVTLITNNAAGSNTITKSEYITVK